MENSSQSPGTLYLIPTPIGNLQDISDRARKTLQMVDIVACEDTRVTGKLLHFLEIQKPLSNYRDQNESAQSKSLVEALRSGKSVGLVSDAGTPTISDPGFRLTRLCHLEKIPVVPLPGPCALTTALCASGLPTDAFYFVGFLPPKSAARQRFFNEHLHFPATLIFYESCHRAEKFLREGLEIFGENRFLSVARELTKKFESIHSGKWSDVMPAVLAGSLKGEFVICIAKEGYEL